MSDYYLPGNGPAKAARTFAGKARSGGEPTEYDLAPEAQAYREYSQIQATLALAYEQRTANLIALAQLCVSIDGPTVDLSEDLQQITERLGMRAEK